MKFALMIDKILHESFTVNENGCFKIKTGKPYSHHSSVENKTAFGVISWPYAFMGDFIKLNEWDELPKNDYDVIMISVERFFDKYPVEKIRKAYPNAVILGTMKEDANLVQFYNEIVKFYNDCDAVIMPFYDTPFNLVPNIRTDVNKPIFSIAQPYNIEYLYNKFYKEEREETFFSYIAPNHSRRSTTEEFANHLGHRFDIPVLRQEIAYYTDRNQWHDFLNIFTPTTFNINCDPEYHQGHQGIQAAIFGIINVGGLNDSHVLLWPETATQDLDILENRVEEYFTNPKKRVEVMKYAWQRLWEYYSYTSAKRRLNDILKQIK